jgi:uncharacterized repeat protein (TIGR03803 family)
LLLLYFSSSALTRAAVIFQNLAGFEVRTNGYYSKAPLLEGDDGEFYGTTCYGGDLGYGTVFKLTKGGTLTRLFSFSGFDGNVPWGGLTWGDDGALYGSTYNGGATVYGGGTIFRMTKDGTLTKLVNLDINTTGIWPYGGLVRAGDGSFYGTTSGGGPGSGGTVFRVTTNGILTVLASFVSPTARGPHAGVVLGRDGSLYGTTYDFGAYGLGSIFRVAIDGTLTTLFSFNGDNGASPSSPLIQASDGNFYGTTFTGGSNTNQNPVDRTRKGYGTVFKITPSGQLRTLVSFQGTNGSSPYYGGLVEGTDGKLYGTTYTSDPLGEGTVFQITKDGTLRALHSMYPPDGSQPYSGLVQGRDGCLYGITATGGNHGNGVAYSVSVPMASALSLSQSGSQIDLNFTSVSGQSYQVERISDLRSSQWINLGNSIVATNGSLSVTDMAGGPGARFYRVITLP